MKDFNIDSESIAYLDKLIQDKKGCLPRAIDGKANYKVIEKINRDLTVLKHIKERIISK